MSFPITTGALQSLDLLLSHPTTTLASHVSIILIITHLSDQSLNQHIQVHCLIHSRYRAQGDHRLILFLLSQIGGVSAAWAVLLSYQPAEPALLSFRKDGKATTRGRL